LTSASSFTSTGTYTSAACQTGRMKRGEEHSIDLQKRQNLQPKCNYECHNGELIPVAIN
jgi:hypothetical protein